MHDDPRLARGGQVGVVWTGRRKLAHDLQRHAHGTLRGVFKRLRKTKTRNHLLSRADHRHATESRDLLADERRKRLGLVIQQLRVRRRTLVDGAVVGFIVEDGDRDLTQLGFAARATDQRGVAALV